MADGLSAISALLREQGRSGVRALKRELFVPEEHVAYDLLMNYYRQHGQLPTPEVFQRQGITLPATEAAFTYFLEELQRRAIYNASRDFHAELSEALRARNTDHMIDITRQMAIQVGTLRADQNVQTAGRVVADVIEDYIQVHDRADLRGITLGWEPLDETTAGAQAGDLIVLLARRGMGKTYALVRMALAAWNVGHSVLFVTMEMTNVQIVRRMVAIRAGINPDLVRRGVLSTRALSRLRETANLFRSNDAPPFWLLPGNFSKSTADVDNLVQEFRPDIVFIDGSYLLKPVQSMKARWEQQTTIHEELKMQTALGRDIPVVCSVQVNRDGARMKKATDGIAAGSDAIEQLASIMILMKKGSGQHAEDRRKMVITKNREGPPGSFTIHFEFSPLCLDVDTTVVHDEEEEEDQRQDQRNDMADLDRNMR